jgi:hypothetical protein
MLVSPEWFNVWGNSSAWVVPRDVSDHCPIILHYDLADWGPKPFRFNNFWLKNKKFKELVVDTWGSQNFTGWMGYILKDRLKGLKNVIKGWNAEVYGRPTERKKCLVDQILALDLKSELTGLSGEEVVVRRRLFDELWWCLKVLMLRFFKDLDQSGLKRGIQTTNTFIRV